MKKKLILAALTLTLLFSGICQFYHAHTSLTQPVSKTYIADETGDDRPDSPITTGYGI